MATYRTKTYIAGDWTTDQNAIAQLYEWKNNNHLNLDFIDAHELTQARDTSLNCTIKASLSKRLAISKTFVLIVGDKTNTLRAGSCQYCDDYSKYIPSYCKRNNSVNLNSYIDYECQKAIKDGLSIVVLYNAAKVNKTNCPVILQNCGAHVAMYRIDNGKRTWDYHTIKNALGC